MANATVRLTAVPAMMSLGAVGGGVGTYGYHFRRCSPVHRFVSDA